MNAEPVVLTAFLAPIECANPVPSLQVLAIFFSIFLRDASQSYQAPRGGQGLAIPLAPGAQLQIAGIRRRARLGGGNHSSSKGLAQVGLQVAHVLDADAQADQTVVDAACLANLGRDAGVRHRCGMANQRFDAAQALSQAE